jgi:hypothetical protein
MLKPEMPEGAPKAKIRLSHPFERDLRLVVILNHSFAMEGIALAEAEELVQFGQVEDAEDDDGGEYARGINDFIREGFNEMRKAAHALAMVGLVTRLHHWVIRSANKLRQQPNFGKSLVAEIGFVSSTFGKPPVPVEYFVGLVTVRDSIIHADSKSEWEFKVRYEGWKNNTYIQAKYDLPRSI